MKKLFTVVFTMLLAGSLAFGQAGTGSTSAPAGSLKSATGKTATKAKKGHKHGKKHKKGSTPAAPSK
jgi:hypothetical protein